MLKRSTDPDDPARPVIEGLIAVPEKERKAQPYVNPARVRPTPGAAVAKQPLTAADIEWLRRLPAEPAQVSVEDATTLARMMSQAASTSDRRLLAAHYGPVWAHHDILEQQAERQIRLENAQAPRGVRSQQVERAAIDALATSVQKQFPELREQEARNRAGEQLRARWAAVDQDRQAEIDAASVSDPPTPRPMPGIEGLSPLAEANQRIEERKAAAPSSLEALGRSIGG